MKPLPRTFYARGAEVVARDLLGMTLVFGLQRARIVETEAYVGPQDLACHAAKGRTKRTEVIFGPPGHAYIYLIYGMYHLLNYVVAKEGDAQAVLVRAVEPLGELLGKTDGPGKLTRTLGIDLTYNGCDVTCPPLYVARGEAPLEVGVSPRIGVDYAGAWAAAPLRFFDAASPFVSKGKMTKLPMGFPA